MTRSPLIVRIAKAGILPLALEAPSFPDMDYAACKGEDVELFFSESLNSIRRAKKLCASCPVLVECETWGTRFAAHGVFGGKTASERLRIDPNLPFYEPRVIVAELRELQNTPITKLAESYRVTTRTISRWRETIAESLAVNSNCNSEK